MLRMTVATASAALVAAASVGFVADDHPDPPPPGGGIWSRVKCTKLDAGCELGAGVGGGTRVSPGKPLPGRVADPQAEPPFESSCTFSDPVEGPIREDWVSRRGLRPDQRLVLQTCGGPGLGAWVVLNPGEGPQAAPTPAQLAASARDRLVLPEVRVAMSPAGPQLVGLPTWLWLDPSSWRPVSRTVGVAGPR